VLGEDPVEPADVPGQQAVPVVVEDLDRPHACAGCDADDAEAVVLGANDAGHVGAVAIPIPPGRPVRGRAVVATGDVQVGVVGDPRVDDGDVGIDLGLRGRRHAVDAAGEGRAPTDPRDARRDDLRGQLHDRIRDDGDDIGVGLNVASLAGVELRGEPVDGPGEAAIGVNALVLVDRGHHGGRVGTVAEDDDVATGGVGTAVGVGGRASRRACAWCRGRFDRGRGIGRRGRVG
jgi:hypothetical protein